MPALPSYFDHFLQDIRPTENQRDGCKTGHHTLRSRLHKDESLKDIVVDTFLQGSYRRATAVRPTGDTKSDVDIITVTNLNKDQITPKRAMDRFVPFLNEHYKGKWRPKGRAFGISLSYVELDLVITAAPSELNREASEQAWRDVAGRSEADIIGETDWIPSSAGRYAQATAAQTFFESLSGKKAAEWKLAPLDIPDRDTNEWDETHPLAQILVTWAKNRLTNRHFVNVVKAIKWWKVSEQSDLKYPKGYPLEHLLWVSCPSGISSVAEGITFALEDMAQRYRSEAESGLVPFVRDHGVPSHNVLGRLEPGDFKTFHERVCEAAQQSRDALEETDVCESAEKWRLLLGTKFPQCPENSKPGGYTPRKEASIIVGGRFA